MQSEAENADINRRPATRLLRGYSDSVARSNTRDSAGKHVRFNLTVETSEEQNVSGDGLGQAFRRLRLV